MLFNSYVFIFVFLPVTLAGFFLLGRLGRRGPALAWLLVASLFFYAWWNPADLPFLLLSIALNYSIAVALRRMQRRDRAARWPPSASPPTCSFSATTSTPASWSRTSTRYWARLARAAPLAAARDFVFHLPADRLSRRRLSRPAATRTGPLRYATGVAFFPHLLAGPIVQYSQLMPQFARRRILRPRALMIAAGLTLHHRALQEGDPGRQFRAVRADAVRRRGRGLQPHARGGVGRRAQLHLPDLFRFLRLFRHGDRPGAAVRHRACRSTSTRPTRREASSISGGAGT